MTRTLAAGALVLVSTLAGASAGSTAPSPGVTATSILLGGTVPLSGQASKFGVVGPSAAAYFKYVNAHGGVFGRKIKYTYLDDGYDASRTVEQTRRLVQDDKVFAIFNSVGTEHNIAIRSYLNAAKVPQLFVGTGADAIGRGYKSSPWTMGYLPSFSGEGAIYGRYIARTRPRAKIAVLFEDSEYGQDLLNGLRAGLGSKAGAIVAKQTYNVFDEDVRSQIVKLRGSKADALMIFALPTQAIQAFIYADQLGWRPKIFVSAVSIEPTVMGIARTTTHNHTTEGAISVIFLKDPTSPRWARDRAVRLYRKILRSYDPGARPSDVYNYYGMAVAFTMVDALKRAGKNLTRESLLRAATHLREANNPFLLPGIVIKTSPTNYFPISKARLARYHKGRWALFGGLVAARR